MANIKISELNELTQEAYDDYLPIVDTSADETKKISVKNLTASGVQLIAVTGTEPTEYETGDKYYNTTNNKIYTATSSGWINPQTPIKNIFYIILETQNIYTYDMDNETLVSVGGGASGGGDTTPIGTVEAYAGSTAPNGYLLCDGSTISRTTYSDLYNVIGTTYGTGDGSTTFNLPNIKGRTVVMLDSTQTEFDTLGETGGSKYLQEHKHSYNNANGHFSGGVNTSFSAPTSGGNATYSNDTQITTGGVLTSGTGGVTTGNSGNLQPYIVLNYIIKVQKLAGEVLSEQLPVGTEVDFDGQASDIPIGWEEVAKESGKTLWEGSFTTGSINVPNLSEYSIIGIIADNVLCIGNKAFGGGIYGMYNATTYGIVSYRIEVSGNTLSTTENAKGAYNNGTQVAITKIIGFL